MTDAEILSRLRAILQQAQALAALDGIVPRVAGERISVIVADVLYEIDPDLDDVTKLLPRMRREPSSA